MKRLTEDEKKKINGGVRYYAECRMGDWNAYGSNYNKVKEAAINHCVSKGTYGSKGHRYTIY